MLLPKIRCINFKEVDGTRYAINPDECPSCRVFSPNILSVSTSSALLAKVTLRQ